MRYKYYINSIELREKAVDFLNKNHSIIIHYGVIIDKIKEAKEIIKQENKCKDCDGWLKIYKTNDYYTYCYGKIDSSKIIAIVEDEDEDDEKRICNYYDEYTGEEESILLPRVKIYLDNNKKSFVYSYESYESINKRLKYKDYMLLDECDKKIERLEKELKEIESKVKIEIGGKDIYNLITNIDGDNYKIQCDCAGRFRNIYRHD